MAYVWLIFGVGALFAGPVWAAWATWPEKRWRAAFIAAGWTSTWCLLVLWLAVR